MCVNMFTVEIMITYTSYTVINITSESGIYRGVHVDGHCRIRESERMIE